jgi:hypothetical protein
MIEQAMAFVVGELNAHLQRQYDQTRNLLVLGPLVSVDGATMTEATHAAIASITNITQDTTLRNQARRQLTVNHAVISRPRIEINVHIIFSAALARYETSLALLSSIILRLHETPVFDVQNSPELPATISRLALSMLNLDYSEQSHLWGGMGAKYVPSVLYEMRMSSSETTNVAAISGTVRGVDVGGASGA